MSLFKRLLGITLFVLSCTSLFAQSQDFKTHTYFKNDSLELKLDLFLPTKNDTATPLIIVIHGGGFSGGKREDFHKFAQEMNKNNIACATISYTLYMKGKNFSCDGILPEKIKAIQIAANQMWLATKFLVDQAKDLNINPEQVFVAGNSAGGETILQGLFWDREKLNLYEHNLSKDFKYAGLISGSGASIDLNMITKDNVVPMFLYHGDSDPIVPYKTAAHHYCETTSSGWLMLFGSYSVAKHIEQLGTNFRLITLENTGHECSSYFLDHEQEEVVHFVHQVLNKHTFQDYLTIRRVIN